MLIIHVFNHVIHVRLSIWKNQLPRIRSIYDIFLLFFYYSKKLITLFVLNNKFHRFSEVDCLFWKCILIPTLNAVTFYWVSIMSISTNYYYISDTRACNFLLEIRDILVFRNCITFISILTTLLLYGTVKKEESTPLITLST